MMKTIGDRILIAPNPSSEEDTAVQYGRVVLCGDACTSVKPGNVVATGKYAGTPIEIDGKSHVIVNEMDVLLIL